MKVGDLVQVKPVHQREFKAIAENRGYPVLPIVGIIIGIEANGYLQLRQSTDARDGTLF